MACRAARSVTDENPLVLPYVKWARERERHPDTTPPLLKIILINLDLRSTESGVVRKLQNLSVLKHIDPTSIRTGRTLEAWQTATYRRGL